MDACVYISLKAIGDKLKDGLKAMGDRQKDGLKDGLKALGNEVKTGLICWCSLFEMNV